MLVVNKMFFIVIIALLTLGCYQPESNFSSNNQNTVENLIPTQLKSSFSLKVNQVAFIKSENLKLKLLVVNKDSRCPAKTQCIWPGSVEIIIKVKKNDQNIDLILIDRGGNSNSRTKVKVFDNYFVELIEVTPYPQKNQKISIESYSAKLIVSRE